MGRPRPNAYSVRLSKEFEEQVQDVFGAFGRWDEVSETLMRDLPLRPHEFPEVPSTGLRAAQIETNPPHTVYFTIEEPEDLIEFRGLL